MRTARGRQDRPGRLSTGPRPAKVRRCFRPVPWARWENAGKKTLLCARGGPRFGLFDNKRLRGKRARSIVGHHHDGTEPAEYRVRPIWGRFATRKKVGPRHQPAKVCRRQRQNGPARYQRGPTKNEFLWQETPQSLKPRLILKTSPGRRPRERKNYPSSSFPSASFMRSPGLRDEFSPTSAGVPFSRLSILEVVSGVEICRSRNGKAPPRSGGNGRPASPQKPGKWKIAGIARVLPGYCRAGRSHRRPLKNRGPPHLPP